MQGPTGPPASPTVEEREADILTPLNELRADAAAATDDASYQMVYGYIYKIGFPNGKVYIGLTTRTLRRRKTEHKWEAKNGNPRYVYNAIRKYNMVDTLELIVIDTAETRDELCRKETEQIEIHQSCNKEYGYNGTRGGDGVVGYEYTEELKQKRSDAAKEHWEDPKARQRASDAAKEQWEDPKARQKASDAMKKRWEDPQARQKASDAMKRQWEDPGARQRLIDALDTPQARQRKSDAAKKRWDDLEARQKVSDVSKEQWEDPQARQRMIDAFNTPQARQKRRAAQKERYYKPFDVFKKDGTYIESFDNQCEALEYLQGSVSRSGVSAALRGKLKSTGGFVFKYRG